MSPEILEITTAGDMDRAPFGYFSEGPLSNCAGARAGDLFIGVYPGEESVTSTSAEPIPDFNNFESRVSWREASLAMFPGSRNLTNDEACAFERIVVENHLESLVEDDEGT